MKKTLLLASTCLILVACGGGETPQNETPIENPTDINVDVHGVTVMDDYHFSDTVSWGSNVYRYTIERHPIESQISVVEEETTIEYRDNQLSLSLNGGNININRDWLKENLSGHIDAHYLQQSIILGMALYNADADGIHFALSVGLPDSDECILLHVRISYNGTIAIVRDEFLEFS